VANEKCYPRFTDNCIYNVVQNRCCFSILRPWVPHQKFSFTLNTTCKLMLGHLGQFKKNWLWFKTTQSSVKSYINIRAIFECFLCIQLSNTHFQIDFCQNFSFSAVFSVFWHLLLCLSSFSAIFLRDVIALKKSRILEEIQSTVCGSVCCSVCCSVCLPICVYVNLGRCVF